jgi:peptide/nickel transport system permease protein
MVRFLIKRLLLMIPLIIGITFISFAAMSVVPGNFLTGLAMNPQISPQVVKQMQAEFGLNQPLLIRYFRWLWQAVHLNLGVSLQYRVGVVSLIASRALNTLILSASSMIFTWLLAIPLGIFVAVKQNSVLDRVLSFVAFLGMSVPAFFLAFLALDFAVWVNKPWLPVGGTFSPDYANLGPWSKLVDRVDHLIMPVLVLGLAGMASLMRLMRSQILEIKRADFVRTARAKGLPESLVIGKHVLRNALNPFVTMAGYALADLLSGAALIEAVMNLQGLGLLLLNAVQSLDVPLVMGSVLMGTVLLLVGNLIADLVLVAVDPRVDFGMMASQ